MLEQLRVVALEQAVAAPLCTRRLAQAGAEIIKIERPEGDFARFYDSATPGYPEPPGALVTRRAPRTWFT